MFIIIVVAVVFVFVVGGVWGFMGLDEKINGRH